MESCDTYRRNTFTVCSKNNANGFIENGKGTRDHVNGKQQGYHSENNNTTKSRSPCTTDNNNESKHRHKENKSSIIWEYITPTFLNTVVPYLFFFEVAAVGIYGIFVAIPALFDTFALFHQVLASVMIFEILINWYFIAYTNSSFDVSLFRGESIEFDSNPGEVPQSVRIPGENNVITQRHHERGHYPYWTWSPCFKCGYWRPPRCYHCALCNQCVLKRDHHCFFARSCIGFYNQKYFVVFCTWTFLSQIYAMVLALKYYFGTFWVHITIFDMLPGFSFLRYVLGYDYGYTGILVLMGWCLLAFIVISFMQFLSAVELLLTGLTTFETDNEIDIKDERSEREKVLAVFGELWGLNFLIPLQGRRYSPRDDPYFWKDLTPPKKKVIVRLCKMENASYE